MTSFRIKKMKLSILLVRITCLIAMTFLFSCEGNKCEDIVCLNGGDCENGRCICPSGRIGLNCECEVLNCENEGFFNEESCACDCPLGCKGNNCESCPVFDNFKPNPIEVCPSQILGDREVGSSPSVSFSTVLYFTRKEIKLDVTFRVEETNNDFSTATGAWQFTLWTAPENYEILRMSPPSRTLGLEGVVHDTKNTICSGEDLSTYLKYICFRANTSGTDIGNCSDDDAVLELYFNTIIVEMIEC